MGVKWSQFAQANSLSGSDEGVGLQNGSNKRWTLNTLLAWIIDHILPSDIGAVPATREINGQALTSDINLDADDVGARPDDWMPSAADVGAQPEIDVSGILKGDGNGGVSAAVAGTDYQTPLAAGTDYATPAMIPAISTATPQMDGTAAAGSTGDVSDAGHVHPSDTNKADLGLLAYVETGSTASRAYAVGEYFCWNGLLYRAKTAISSGANITMGTNCEQTTVTSMPGYLELWTNSNTGSTFAAQDIPGTGGFRLYLVVCRITTSSQGYASYWLNCDTGEMQNITFVSSPASTVPYISFRQVTKQQSGLLNISDCDTRAITATSRSQDNSQLIPYKIFGIY